MEQNNPQDGYFQHSKQAQFIKIIALRKQCKKLQQKEHLLDSETSLFSKIPLLLTKYEILPNLCYYGNIYFAFDIKKHSILFYDFRVETTIDLKNVENKGLEDAFLYQVTDYDIIISFGNIQQTDQISLLWKKGQEPQMRTLNIFKMKSCRYIHKVTMNDNYTLFYIGGNGDKVNNDCETLNLRNKKQSLTSSIPCNVRGEGACFGGEDLYLTGGFQIKEGRFSQLIQYYSPQRNQWSQSQALIPCPTQIVQSEYTKDKKAILIFEGKQMHQFNYLFDMKNVSEYGFKAPC